ncbi:hypothetical protein QJS10_CPB12g01286 [Acorus calamus]|uniref:Peptidase S59 domain-containing protein n=1 Tax=Acorus calamus TaxID=4465 RepID=A0AAV9DPC9_ACOCL|nr:hypothetical protein QJS10_CPB12g01286 [Acorus calamus]
MLRKNLTLRDPNQNPSNPNNPNNAQNPNSLYLAAYSGMAPASSLSPTGLLDEFHNMRGNFMFGQNPTNRFEETASGMPSIFKKRKVHPNTDPTKAPHGVESPSRMVLGNIEASLPILRSHDYFMEPSLNELMTREITDAGYCSRVQDFMVGRLGYGYIRFYGETDVRWLFLDQIVKFEKNTVSVYENEIEAPPLGQGLNKPAEVSLLLRLRSPVMEGPSLSKFLKKLKARTESLGGTFISYAPSNGEWKFSVTHFSRYGLADDDEEDVVMDDAGVRRVAEPSGTAGVDVDEEFHMDFSGSVLSHSLPAHLGLDPVKMREMRMLLFPENTWDNVDGLHTNEKHSFEKDYMRVDSPTSSMKYSAEKSSLLGSSRKTSKKISSVAPRKTPQALLKYSRNGIDCSPPRNILMTWQNKSTPVRVSKVEGFKLDLQHPTPMSNNRFNNVVDAGLFMGRSFRVGWGPNGVLVHSGMPVCNPDLKTGLSSVINVERIAIDRPIRDEKNTVKEELLDICFASPLTLHKSLDHESREIEVGSYILKLQRVVSSRLNLSYICQSYIEIVERKLDIPGLSAHGRAVLMHQIMVWALIKVLFSEREIGGKLNFEMSDEGEEMMLDRKEGPVDIDPEAGPFVRRAEFSNWLQESVCNRVQEEVSGLNEESELEHIFKLMTGRQLAAAVELAVSRGDVRLACLVSQAGGSMVNRDDMARQMEIWRMNGLDFNFIENGRLRLYNLLAGNIQGSLQGSTLDWKRYLGLLMWYQLPPDSSLPVIINTYQQLLNEGKAPYPVPHYIDEGPLDEAVEWSLGDRFDISYYLMLLHANGEKTFANLKTMFSSYASTHDPLDYHMIWHQCAILESIGAVSSNDLHVLDMSLVSQLLCVGMCHWAIYVIIHMPYSDKSPYIQANLIREILFQYCETWSTDEKQQQFIEELGIPPAWMHEALAIYFFYYGDSSRALEHFLKCSNWQKAHSIFMTSVAHSLFLSSKDSEILELALGMERHKSEIADWQLGAGIYIDFYELRSSLQDEDITSDMDSLEKKNDACRSFFSRLNKSLSVWGSKIPMDVRAVFAKMAEELCSLLVADRGESSAPSIQMSCFDTMFIAPLPEDLRSCHLQNAISVFTYYLTEGAN